MYGVPHLQKVFPPLQVGKNVKLTVWLVVIVLGHSSSVSPVISCTTAVSVSTTDLDLPSGPYVLDTDAGRIYEVSLLQTDTHLAFTYGVVPQSRGQQSFTAIPECLGVPVPSKLYHANDTRPLAGLRFAVKDNVAARGLKNAFGSKAWFDTYDSATTTSPSVQALLDAGAVLVGQVKSTEFADGLNPSEWVHFPCPYNPRGDGQQKVSSSSAGSAAAAASYQWVDFTVGTDTGGSIRHPAGVQGVYGQRPSTLSVSIDGVLGATSLFDTVGIFARDIDTFCRAGAQIATSAPATFSRPSKRKFNLLYPTRAADRVNPDLHHHGQHRWWPSPDVDRSIWTEAEKLLDGVVSQIETALACKRFIFNINELWAATPPIGHSRSLDKAVGRVYSTITTSAMVHTHIDRFNADYALKHNGALPKISPLLQQRFDHGRKISTKKAAKALEAMQAFARWVETTLFGSHDQDAMTLLIYPQTCGRPDYRDDQFERKELFNDTFSIYSFGYLVGCPDFTIPVGEVPFLSKVTGKLEYLPVSLSLVSQPGTDRELFDVLQDLKKAGVIQDVLPGSRMYDKPALKAEVDALQC